MTTTGSISIKRTPIAPWEGYPHILRAKQFPPDWIKGTLFPLIEDIRNDGGLKWYPGMLDGKSVALAFWGSGVRTKTFFRIAAEKLGARVLVEEHADRFSGTVSGGHVEHIVRMYHVLGFNALIIQNPKKDSAQTAANVADELHRKTGRRMVIINAGEIEDEYPPQSLNDLYSLWRHFGRLTNLTVGIVGDLLQSPTAHALAYHLGRSGGNRLLLISPSNAMMKPKVMDYLARHQVDVEVITPEKLSVGPDASGELRTDLRHYAPLVDAFYVVNTHMGLHGQQVDTASLGRYPELFVVDAFVADAMREGAGIFHPMPITNEILGVDTHPRTQFFHQLEDGLYTDMALLVASLPQEARGR